MCHKFYASRTFDGTGFATSDAKKKVVVAVYLLLEMDSISFCRHLAGHSCEECQVCGQRTSVSSREIFDTTQASLCSCDGLVASLISMECLTVTMYCPGNSLSSNAIKSERATYLLGTRQVAITRLSARDRGCDILCTRRECRSNEAGKALRERKNSRGRAAT